jgi:SulP family sulfate permease
MSNWKRFLPIAEWLPGYGRELLKGDLSAGLTVGVMLVPQGMAYAMIAGLPPIHGLYASTIPLLLYAVLGTSRQLAVGPVAMISLLTATSIGALNPEGPADYLLYAVTAAMMVGVLQFLMGFFRLGFLVNFLSHPVISGFTSAAAIIIGLSQLKHLLRINLPQTEHVHEILWAAIQGIGEVHWITLLIGIAGIALISNAKRIHTALPGSLLAVVLGILAVWGLGLEAFGVKVVGSVPSGLPGFSMPSFNSEVLTALLPGVLAMSLIGFMESFAVAKAIQSKRKNYEIDANQELMALGVANLGASVVQGYPVTGGFSRTAVNDQAGANTGMATIFAAVLVLLTLLFLTPLFYYLPNAILASVILVAVWKLIDYREAIHLWHKDRSDFWMLMSTFVVTLTLGIEIGIATGVMLSLAMVIFRSTRPHLAELGRIPNTPHYRNVNRFGTVETRPDILLVRFDGPLYFANGNYFKDKVNELARSKGPELKLILLNAESMTSLDSSGVHTLEAWVKEWQQRGVKVYLSGVIGPVRDLLRRWGLVEVIGEKHFFLANQPAIDYYDGQQEALDQENHHDYVLQTNA